MQTTFTHAFMRENRGCYTLSDLMKCSFMSKQTVTIFDILDSEISLEDKFWFVCHAVANKEQCIKIAYSVIELVLPVYESLNSNDWRLRNAVNAIKTGNYLKLPELKSSVIVVRREHILDSVSSSLCNDAAIDLSASVLCAINCVMDDSSILNYRSSAFCSAARAIRAAKIFNPKLNLLYSLKQFIHDHQTPIQHV